ncbi:HD domain-containing phosphohydrolase [Saccharibacillus alkalitolerans]|uniref:HD domain-containing protein n=1 Tax=Saccharibacillus alkalitolerans TaxID=2705290 RepID=A0ABX0FA77_9BACL|nr:HD domain-containing phosphohydrolase [Saccharibacillus alkalitolerans]NGZ76379.1 HD domain-containing protein [Saccharibacillus alkalitolerans]
MNGYPGNGQSSPSTEGEWNILLIANERNEAVLLSRLLADFRFEGRGVRLLYADGALEARLVLEEERDIAVVMMELDDSGDRQPLALIAHIRQTLLNAAVRIVIVADRCWAEAEEEIMQNYDINNFRLKGEFDGGTARLKSALVGSLRGYRDFKKTEDEKKSLEYVALSSSLMLNAGTLEELAQDVLRHLASILNARASFDGLVLQRSDRKWRKLAAVGRYKELDASTLPREVENVLPRLRTLDPASLTLEGFSFYSPSGAGTERLIFVGGGRTPSEWEYYLAESYCANTDAVFENMELRHEIESTQKEIIYTLGEIAETRSQETGFHVKRVAEYTKLLALKYGLSEEEANLLALASPMHDIGKVGISDAILNKPGKLTAEEYATMQSHALSGYEMLKHSNRPILKTAAIIALQHHEKYGGGGYPQGLKGEDIHLYGRITAIADVFDALASDRVYKKAWPLADIVELFRKERGGHFDPILTDLFLEHLDEFLAIRASYADEKVF